MIRRRRLTAVALIAVAVALPLTAKSSIEDRIAAERAKAAAIAARLHAKRAELHSVSLRYDDLQRQLGETNAAIGTVSGRIDSLDAQRAATQRRIDWNAVQLAAAVRSLRLHDSLLKRRLVNIYEYGDLTYLNALLAARSFSEFVERWEDLRLLIAANQRAVRARKAAERRVATIAADLDRTRLELQREEESAQEARSQLGSLADERRNLVEVASIQRRSVASQVAQIEGLSAAEEAQLESLIMEREREVEAQRRAAGIAGGVESEGAAGSFSWPVTGTITSPFGWRSNPFGGAPEFHQGLDIAAPTGTTVTAAAAGTVIMAQWYGGYGNYILIDHGGGYSTGYGHLSAIFVSTGQTVARGQAIGAVGSTGQSTGPHLHFEVRIAGKPVDPAPRLH
ncbi:MAG: peptidoglycan DD-metalloendopeptidase family protein [Candidatus Eremiobacteraeota bacterium]|nr:peptidoglycan DD-metalloendopeptidase family protein [Candidatus Eremiobacteraeota bacterium]MBV9055764.1 peptidoglycan DD-metalloendopeptidase family protein [Candidatus Eremiobacteraeota bacterium]MBV9699150.1 peptidoglycan DD-metalloendopeptidase family protein [Candidatus Eremiobacteraeota bacterium]